MKRIFLLILCMPGLALAVSLLPVSDTWQADLQRLEDGYQAWIQERRPEAIELWKTAAENGQALAQLRLAHIHANGLAGDQDYDQALHYLRLASELGLADAQYQLGLMYELGLGVEVDAGEAEYWYGRAVDQDFCPGELDPSGGLAETVN